ncbi:histidine phosphatase family protein [Limnobacter humi]|uniref:Histidine phosphatase family protein n=1 Tax=Limnobacter humi TaxID=1778671 RepID=A0ABT1WD96_9BURK|nr:histidine phosphatase family protein [Limnobacter humi]MCQ8895502.1 histidine phosphatase family protein [Limnobacter humi]
MGSIYLIRHGQASFYSADYDQLSDLGDVQSRQLGAWFRARKVPIHAVYSGGMKRHRQTAQAFEQQYGGLPEPVIHMGFNEYDHEAILTAFVGQFEDSDAFDRHMASSTNPKKAFQAIFEKAVARWVSGEHDSDYPESWTAFKSRVMAGLGHVVANSLRLDTGDESASIVVFTSGGAITCIAQQLLNVPDVQAFNLNWTITNCSVSKLLFNTRGGVTLASFNEQAHFEGHVQGLLNEQAQGLDTFAHRQNGLLTYR